MVVRLRLETADLLDKCTTLETQLEELGETKSSAKTFHTTLVQTDDQSVPKETSSSEAPKTPLSKQKFTEIICKRNHEVASYKARIDQLQKQMNLMHAENMTMKQHLDKRIASGEISPVKSSTGMQVVSIPSGMHSPSSLQVATMASGTQMQLANISPPKASMQHLHAMSLLQRSGSAALPRPMDHVHSGVQATIDWKSKEVQTEDFLPPLEETLFLTTSKTRSPLRRRRAGTHSPIQRSPRSKLLQQPPVQIIHKSTSFFQSMFTTASFSLYSIVMWTFGAFVGVWLVSSLIRANVLRVMTPSSLDSNAYMHSDSPFFFPMETSSADTKWQAYDLDHDGELENHEDWTHIMHQWFDWAQASVFGDGDFDVSEEPHRPLGEFDAGLSMSDIPV